MWTSEIGKISELKYYKTYVLDGKNSFSTLVLPTSVYFQIIGVHVSIKTLSINIFIHCKYIKY